MARTNATNFSGGLQFPYATAAADLFKKEDIQTLALAVDQHTHGTGKGLPIDVATIPGGSIPGSAIADGGITSAKIADGTIQGADLIDGAITSAKIADGTIQTVDLIDGCVTSVKIADGTIQTADLGANTITQAGLAVGSSSSPTTTSAGLADMPDMAVTLTCTGGDLLVSFCGTFTESAAGQYATLTFRIDAATEYTFALWQAPSTGFTPVSGDYCFQSVSAGAHTVKVRWSTSAGTLTAYSTVRELTVVERKR